MTQDSSNPKSRCDQAGFLARSGFDKAALERDILPMKTLFGLAVLVVGVGCVQGQTNAMPSSAATSQRTQRSVRRASVEAPVAPTAGRLARGKTRYTGFLVEFARTPHPLRWVDPFHPENSSPATENVLRDPRTGRAQGIALLSLRF